MERTCLHRNLEKVIEFTLPVALILSVLTLVLISILA